MEVDSNGMPLRAWTIRATTYSACGPDPKTVLKRLAKAADLKQNVGDLQISVTFIPEHGGSDPAHYEGMLTVTY